MRQLGKRSLLGSLFSAALAVWTLGCEPNAAQLEDGRFTSQQNKYTASDVTIQEYKGPLLLSGVCEVEFDHTGILWIEQFIQSKIGRLDPATGAYSEILLEPAAIPGGMETGPDGGIWFPELLGNQVVRLEPSDGSLQFYPLPWANALSIPVGQQGINYGASLSNDMTKGADGAMWFTLGGLNAIGRMDIQTKQMTKYTLPTLGALYQAGAALNIIKQGPGNLVVFIEPLANKIGAIDVFTKEIKEYSIPTPNSLPSGVNRGPDGAIWFTEGLAQKIGRINPVTGEIKEYNLLSLGGVIGDVLGGGIGTPLPIPGPITSGSDGNLYFAQNPGATQGGNKIGRFNPRTLQYNDFPTPTPVSSPCDLNNQRAGEIWFGELTASQVGRLIFSH
jgi:virginiamycin B lyase